MKKLLLALSTPLLLCSYEFSTQLRTGYFLPQSSDFRSIFHGGVEFEIESSAYVAKHTPLWINFNSFIKSGKSLGLQDPTSVRIYPLSAGLKYEVKITQTVDWYIGLGASYNWVFTKDDSPYVQPKTHVHGWGGVAKTGFLLHFKKRYFFDFFADYYYTRLQGPSSSEVSSPCTQLGGLRSGVGLGICY